MGGIGTAAMLKAFRSIPGLTAVMSLARSLLEHPHPKARQVEEQKYLRELSTPSGAHRAPPRAQGTAYLRGRTSRRAG